MKHTLIKSLSLSVVAGMTLWGSSVYAANENIEVTPSQEIPSKNWLRFMSFLKFAQAWSKTKQIQSGL